MSAGPKVSTERRQPSPNGPHQRPACPDAPRPSVQAHRESVVRRLLARGLSASTLIALLPDWRPVVERVSGRR